MLFDVAVGADADLEDHLHEVGIDYLDRLLDVTGEEYFGTHQIEP